MSKCKDGQAALEGWECAAEDGVRHLQRHGIQARGKRKFIVTTDSRHELPIAPNLLDRHFTVETPNAVWTSDITYIATDEGWLYPEGINI